MGRKAADPQPLKAVFIVMDRKWLVNEWLVDEWLVDEWLVNEWLAAPRQEWWVRRVGRASALCVSLRFPPLLLL